jgi:hypothetical protein
MPFIEAPTNFYMGRVFDPKEDKLTDDVVYYDSRDLTTHAVVVGMTGSGKTGLCISMLEEAILDNIPAIIIDPKGDICNLALTFPELRPENFKPWINEDDARRSNMSMDSYAGNVAQTWQEGLRNWGIVPDRLTWLKHAAKLSIYTPGSDAGLPISILASLRAPRFNWAGQEELIRERITGVVTALFTLAGMSFQPVKDVQHVFVSNIIEFNWRQGRDLTLEDIIIQIKQPPFERLGAFTVDQYYPEKQRYKLAMDLNNIIAAPSFQTWIQGEPLDIQNLLYQPNGRPKVSIFYIAHLSDQERMFITTLILESMIAWMRTQAGTPSLRALLYIDEVFGYFPPYPKNPPTKEPIMRLLKQARAFGIGLILATQNPADLDYKGLSNAGTWLIGRLSSENDKQRVLAGLQELASADDDLSLSDVGQLISDIPPRVFLMRNVHNAGGAFMVHSRWAMNYLAGPMTRTQISWLMQAQRQQLSLQSGNTQSWTQPYQAFNAQTNAPANNFATPALQPATRFGGANMPPPPPMGVSGQPNMPPPPAFGGEYTSATGSQPTYNYAPPPPSFNPPQAFGAQSAPPPPSFGAQSAPSQDLQPMRTNTLPGGFMTTRPPLTQELRQYFLPTTLSSQQAFVQARQNLPQGQIMTAYVPVLFAQIQVRYQHRASQIYFSREFAYHVPDLSLNGLVHWEQHQAPVVDSRMLSNEPFGQAIYQELPVGLTDVKRINNLQRDLVDMVANTARLTVLFHPQFKLYGDPNRDSSEFYAQVKQIAQEKSAQEAAKLDQKYGQAMDKLEDKYRNEERRLSANRQEVKDRKREQMFTTGEAVLSIFKGNTNYTLSRMSRAGRMSRQTEMDIQDNQETLGEITRQVQELENEYANVMQQTVDKWARIAVEVQEFTITPFKKDIAVALYGVGWIPHYYGTFNGQPVVVPAFG